MTEDTLRNDFRRMLGDGAVVEPDEQIGYEHGQRYGAGKAAAVVRPASTQDVAAVMRYCHAHNLRFVAQGANTGLVAASTPDASGGQVVLSLERLRGVHSLDPVERVAICGAGTRLSDLNAAAKPYGLSLPIDLGADPSLGGMVATNTGGSRLIRYGDMRRNLLGLEVVLADGEGTIVSNLKGLRKDNTGLDLKQLFTGTGGTYGIVTQVQVELHCLPRQSSNAMVVPASIEAIPALLAEVEGRLGELLAAAEGISGSALRAALDHQPMLRDPFAGEPMPDYVLLIEATTTLGPDSGIDLDEIMLSALAPCMEGANPVAVDVRLGRGNDFWNIRHAISEGVRACGRVIAFDIAAPRSAFPRLRQELSERVKACRADLLVMDFGHVGDGGMHFNLVLPHGMVMDDAEVFELRRALYDCTVRQHGGSFSAEHGVGPYNLDFYERYTPAAERMIAARIAQTLNPAGLLGAFALGDS